ncbi:MAG: 1-acyl-sn-glycerol-3-phosphate acyltransferase [Rhodocyclales bacterium]|nr:1-acyl-sn-glycerol-3-phosphate acyltransferase [Rhodocyclales bacterium]
MRSLLALPVYFRLTLIGLHLLWGATQVVICFPLAGSAARDRLKRCWSRQLLALLGIRLETAQGDLDRIGSGLLVANHVSFVDIFAINATLPSGFVAKDDVASWPLIGWLARRNGTVFIERGKRRSAQRTQQEIGAMLVAGHRLSIFPEGTTSAGDRVLPFHSALFQAAIDAGVPIHALAIDYVDDQGHPSPTVAYIDELSLLDCLRRILGRPGLRVRLRLAASFTPPYADRRHVAHSAHQAVASVLRRRPAAPPSLQPLRNTAAISP